MSRFLEYSGQTHLLFVHLPIGMMLLALVFQRMGRKPKNAVFRSVVPTTLLVASAFAILSCISGYLISRQGDYDAFELRWHLWLSVVLTVLSVIAWRFSGRPPGSWQVDVWRNFISVAIFILMLITGYLGSSLSHGKGYLKGKFNTETVVPPPGTPEQ